LISPKGASQETRTGLKAVASSDAKVQTSCKQNLRKKVTLVDSDRRGLLIRLIRIARALVRNDCDVKILEWDRTGARPRVEHIEECEVHNCRLKPLSSKAWALVPYYFIWWFYVVLFLLRDDSDLYHTENLYNLVPCILIKIIKRKKIVYDLIDFVADSFKWPELIRRFLAGLENFCLRFADGVIVVDARKQQLNMSNVKKFAVVANCSVDLKGKFEDQKEQDEFIVYYGGWISETRGLRHICKVIKDLEGVKLVIAGFGPDEAKVRVDFGSQENIEFKGLLSDVESLKWTSKADVIFAFYDPKIRINRLASPAKLYDAMMCGKPVLVNSEALPVAQTVKEENCGLIIPYGDIQGIKAAIQKLKEDVNLRMNMGRNGRKAFEREYNWTEMEARLLKLYDEIRLARD